MNKRWKRLCGMGSTLLWKGAADERSSTLLFRMVFVLSGWEMTVLLSRLYDFGFVICGVACSLFVLLALAFRLRFLERVFSLHGAANKLLSLVLAVQAAHRMGGRFLENFSSQLDGLAAFFHMAGNRPTFDRFFVLAAAAVALPAVFVFAYAFVSRFVRGLKRLVCAMDRVDRRYLWIAGILLVACVVVVFSLTSVFYQPVIAGTPMLVDVVYTTDSGILYHLDAFTDFNNSQNDIRQPLFALFAMPFATLAAVLSKLLFFWPQAYPVLLSGMQALLLPLSYVMLARTLRLRGGTKALFLALCTALYPTLLYTLTLEQYVFSLFWLMAFLYMAAFQGDNRDECFIGAAGCMITSAVLFPLLSEEKHWKGWIMEVARVALKFLATLTVFGQLPLLLGAPFNLSVLMNYTGVELTFVDKLRQYVNFVAACFARPVAGVNTTYAAYPTWQLAPVTGWNVAGIVLLCAAALGFWLNRKNRMARISAGWIALSFVTLCVVGWGTGENGLVLYTLYFAWAFLILLFLLAERALARWPAVRYALYTACALALLVINAVGVRDIAAFGIQYAP